MKKLLIILMATLPLIGASAEVKETTDDETGCSCKNLPRPIDEYDFVTADLLGNALQVIQLCADSELLTERTLSDLQSSFSAEGSIVLADVCECPGVPPEGMAQTFLIEKNAERALIGALKECKDNIDNPKNMEI